MKTEEYKDNASSRSSLMRGSEAVARSMQRAALDGVELEYGVRGSGEPVLLVHAGAFADWFVPLMAESSLARQYALIDYHRVGYGGSGHPKGPISIADQAAHCRMLLGHLGWSERMSSATPPGRT